MYQPNALLIPNTPFQPLGASESYTGQWIEYYQWNSLVISGYSDVSGTLYIDISVDGVTADKTFVYNIEAGVSEDHRITNKRRYFRLRYTNDVTPQTECRIQIIAGNESILTAPLNETIQLDADAVLIRSLPSILEIGKGRFDGIGKNNKSGRNGDIDTGTLPEWIWENGGVYTGFPLGDAETLQVVSTDANDTAAGTGARTINVIGLDENWLISSETITLNGLTPVTSTKLFRRVHTASVQTSGNNNQNFNVGTITVRHSTTTANVFLTIQAGRNQSNAAVYTVPDRKIGIQLNLKVEVDRSNTSSITGFMWVREFGKAPRYRRPFTASNSSTFTEEPYGGITYPAKTDMGVVVTACSANNTSVQAAFDIILIDDD